MAAQCLKDGIINNCSLPNPDTSSVSNILGIVFTVIGALAFLMLVIAGFRYVLAAGEPQKVAEARRQIVYTAVGLILAITADAIVHFVVGKT